MKTVMRFNFALLLTGLCFLSIACQREEPTTIKTNSLLPSAGAGRDCFTIMLPTTIVYEKKGDYGYPKIDHSKSYQMPCLEIPEYIELVPSSGCRECLFDRLSEMVKTIPASRFKDLRKVNANVLSSGANAVTFPLTSGTIGVQFYTENELINKRSFTFRNDVVLTVDQQKALGTRGITIPAGIHPVIYNVQNNIYTAIIGVL